MRNETIRTWGLCGVALAMTVAGPVGAQAPQSASLTLGGQVVLTLRAAAGGMTPQQRVDTIDGRLSDLLGTPHITPANVAVYTPKGKPPVIYALGRRLITVDGATVKAEGGGKTPLALATQWAKRLQQVLPRVNWRPSNEAEPNVPADPPLTVADDLSQVGGSVGDVTLRDKVVIRLRGPQNGGLTAQERADILSRRLRAAANKLGADPTAGVTVKPLPTKAAPASKGDTKAADAKTVTPDATAQQILLGSTPVLTVDAQEAKAAGAASPAVLATSWAKNIRGALGLTAQSAPVPTPAAPAAENPAAPVSPAPAAPVTGAPAPTGALPPGG